MSNGSSVYQLEHPRSFLDEAYSVLDYQNGTLLDAIDSPNNTIDEEIWLEKGDWLTLAYKAGAEKVLFVNNDPVIVFCEINHIPSDEELLNQFKRFWCMERPRCLYIASPGELRVYNLTRHPTQDIETLQKNAQLALLKSVKEVVKKLYNYRREQVESYQLFEDERFGASDQRVDKQLIQDLKIVRQYLLGRGLAPQYAHALIGRSIFIRYLEDREVLVPEYFEQIAGRNSYWKNLLATNPGRIDLSLQQEKRRYYRVLQDKDFTYALFDKLAEDFNGDMFPKDEQEKKHVTEDHLRLLQGLLLGDADEQQPKLFFWAYDFEIIPIEFISNIYEEFYHVSNEVDDKGTHYTPSVLVEFVLSQILKAGFLAKNPRILDPACGSGIFLVEAFRRIVRYKVKKQGGRPLSSEALRTILRDQIVGIEINEEAIRIAAFSLYLAMLHYQSPRNILESRPLPNLIYQKGHERDRQHYQILFCSNAFTLTPDDVKTLQEMQDYKNEDQRRTIGLLLDTKKSLDLSSGSFDVIIGNPPWSGGSYIVSCGNLPPLKDIPHPFVYKRESHTLSASTDILPPHVLRAKQNLPLSYHQLIDELKFLSDENAQAVRWAIAHNKPVGDKSYSQLFIYRALSFVKKGGIIGLLVHANILFNQSATSQAFRQSWLTSAKINQVINFVRVRRLFFGKAVAPFIFVCFEHKKTENENSYISYTSAHLTKLAERTRTVHLSKADKRLVRQSELQTRDYLWKTYWWGNHRDAALLSHLDWELSLKDILPEEPEPHYGFQRGSKTPSRTLQVLRPLNSKKMQWYGPLREDWFEESPKGVKRDPDESIYHGQRLIVGRGAKVGGVNVRLEYEDFSFRHTIYGVPLSFLSEWQAKVIIGTIWSSLGKYRLFMTSGRWGTWHDETVSTDVLSMPVRLPKEKTSLTETIISIVDDIRQGNPSGSLYGENFGAPPSRLIERLDEAVFDLFELAEAERDLVRDFITYKFNLFSQGAQSNALEEIRFHTPNWQGTSKSLDIHQGTQTQMDLYLSAFLKIWNRELEPEGEFRWQIVLPPKASIVAVIFTTQEKGEALLPLLSSMSGDWSKVLAQCSDYLEEKLSKSIYVDTMVRVVSDTDIFIIKRNEKRLWTASIAREDAEAVLLQAIYLQEKVQ